MSSVKEYVLFKIGKNTWGIELLLVQEIIKPVPITEVPKAPRGVMGVINLRGEVVPMINLADVMGFEFEKSKKNRVLIVKIGTRTFGFLIEELLEIAYLKEEDVDHIRETLPDFAPEFIESVADKDGKIVYILNPEDVINYLEGEAV